VRKFIVVSLWKKFALLFRTVSTQNPLPIKNLETSRAVPMSDDRFWMLVGQTLRFEDEPEIQLAELQRDLAKLSAAEIVAFELAFGRKLVASYTWELWGAAYVVHGGCSDDGFEYFRRWLISKGRKVFDIVLANPDSLANFDGSTVEGYYEFEEFASAAPNAWQAKTGKDPYQSDEFPFASGETAGNDPSGVQFDDDADYLAKAYPKLWAKFGEDPLPRD
jgi:Protein of unknown function (DUF4240)